MLKKIIIISEKPIFICYYISGEKSMLDFCLYNNKKIELEYKDIPYSEKMSIIHFNIKDTKYYLNKKKEIFKYKTLEEEVIIDFQNKTLSVHLLKHGYKLPINLLNSTYKEDNKSIKMEYVLETEKDKKRKVIITLH